MQKEFGILDDFTIKFVTEDGNLMELSGNNWEQLKTLGETTQIQLAIELSNDIVDEEPSNYEEDDFEAEEEKQPQKVIKDLVPFSKVQMNFEELRIILQIKKVKKGDALKYILHGVRDDADKKVRIVTLE